MKHEAEEAGGTGREEGKEEEEERTGQAGNRADRKQAHPSAI